jgi:hypothetical protein
MIPQAPTSNPRQHEPLYDIVPETSVSIEVFYSDRTLETFGRDGAGWFWWPRRRGLSPDGPATGPFELRSISPRTDQRIASIVSRASQQPAPLNTYRACRVDEESGLTGLQAAPLGHLLGHDAEAVKNISNFRM